jgi:hypothetical protein
MVAISLISWIIATLFLFYVFHVRGGKYVEFQISSLRLKAVLILVYLVLGYMIMSLFVGLFIPLDSV